MRWQARVIFSVDGKPCGTYHAVLTTGTAEDAIRRVIKESDNSPHARLPGCRRRVELLPLSGGSQAEGTITPQV